MKKEQIREAVYWMYRSVLALSLVSISSTSGQDLPSNRDRLVVSRFGNFDQTNVTLGNEGSLGAKGGGAGCTTNILGLRRVNSVASPLSTPKLTIEIIKRVQGEGTVVGWGDDSYSQATAPTTLTGVVAITAGATHSVALKSDGTVVAWGGNEYGQTDVPIGLEGVVEVAAGGYHTAVLKRGGSVVAWGLNNAGQTGVPTGLGTVDRLTAGLLNTVALTSDGQAVSWGYRNEDRQGGISELSRATTITAGNYHIAGLFSDGTVFVVRGIFPPPKRFEGVIAIAAGGENTLAVNAHGTVTAWGEDDFGQTDVPADLKDVISVAVSRYHSVALRKDGTLVAWGRETEGQTTIPVGLRAVRAVAAGPFHTLAILNDSVEITKVRTRFDAEFEGRFKLESSYDLKSWTATKSSERTPDTKMENEFNISSSDRYFRLVQTP